MTSPIYLDNHATTATDPAVVEAMLPYFSEKYGNAGSASHAHGWVAAKAVDLAREKLAGLLGVESEEIVFTSGATESNNLAILGIAAARGRAGGRIVTTAVEHRAVLDTAAALKAQGVETVVVGVDEHGRVSPDAIEAAVDDQTILVSVMAANNEVGTLQPIAEVARVTRARGIPFHCDAAQAVGRIPVDVPALGVDLLSLSAHKFHGPKGVGALYVRRRPRVALRPVLFGGGQEGGLRPGTTNVPGVVGLGVAAELARAELPEAAARRARLRDELERRLREGIDGLRVNGHPQERLPGNLNVSIPGIDGEELLLALKSLAVSSGSACSSGSTRTSHVLRAMGVPDDAARATLRFGLGRFTTEDDVTTAADVTVAAVQQLRSLPAAP